MSISTRSRSSSLFSLTSTATSRTSAPTSPRTTGWDEKLEASAAPLVLRWKPQLFTTAFSSSRSTHLRFTAFPPQNVPKATFERVGVEAAMSLMHQSGDPTVLSMFATAQSQVKPTRDISIPSSLATEVAFLLRSGEWDFYSITGTAPLPIGIGSMNTTFRHCVAFRKLRNGFERYIFGPWDRASTQSASSKMLAHSQSKTYLGKLYTWRRRRKFSAAKPSSGGSRVKYRGRRRRVTSSCG